LQTLLFAFSIQIGTRRSQAPDTKTNEHQLGLDGTIVFNTPNYKVWVGNFRTKIEAKRNLIDIRRKYEDAYLIKPQK